MAVSPQETSLAWGARFAPTLDDIEALASQALRELPEPFKGLASDVTCSVAEFAEDDVLEGFGMESPVVGGYTPEKVALRRAIALAVNVEEEYH